MKLGDQQASGNVEDRRGIGMVGWKQFIFQPGASA